SNTRHSACTCLWRGPMNSTQTRPDKHEERAMFKEGAKLLGHPIHQMLIVFPLGLLATSIVFDIIYLAGGGSHWADISVWTIAAGYIGGSTGGVFWLLMLVPVPPHTRTV